MTRDPDRDTLLENCANGDRVAFAALYTTHLNELYKYMYLFTHSKEWSEEIVHDVFIKIWERRTQLSEVRSFRPYLYRVAKNLLIDQLRRQRTEQGIINLIKPQSEKSDEQTDATLIYNQYCELGQQAIDLLPPKRKVIFELRTKEDLSLDEIAEKLGITKSVVKKQLYTAMDFVREHLEKHAGLSVAGLLFCVSFLPN